MWREFMDIALAKLPEESFNQPWYPTEGVKPVIRGQYIDTNALIDSVQNQNSTSTDETQNNKLQFSDIYNNIHTILYYVDRNDPMGPAPASPGNDPQYNSWEYGVQRWKESTFGSYAQGAASSTQAVVEEEEETPTTRRRNRN
jgi:hypothetical protein